MNYVEPIRDIEKVKAIGQYLKEINDKYYIMYMIGIYSGLRISDILRLKIRDVKDRDPIRLREKKTSKEKIFPVGDELRAALATYTQGRDLDSYVVYSDRADNKAVSREYAYRVIHKAGEAFDLDNLGTHTMRKTFGYHFYMKTKDIVLLMKIFNHSDQSKTLRYIGIEQQSIEEAMRNFNYD